MKSLFKKVMCTFMVGLLMLGVTLIPSTNKVHASSFSFTLTKVSSAVSTGYRYILKNTQYNEHETINLTTKYPAITTVWAGGYGDQNIWVDNNYMGKLQDNNPNIYLQDFKDNDYSVEVTFVLKNLKPGIHTIEVIGTPASGSPESDYAVVNIPQN